MRKKESPMRALKIAGCLLVIVVFCYIGYSVWFYTQNAEKVDEFEVCYEDRCIKTFHVHYTLLIDICGKTMHLPLEHGDLKGIHTHKEANYLHFHERIEYDPKTSRLFDDSPFILNTTMNVFGIRFNKNCIGDYCTGDLCPDDGPGSVSMTVNNLPTNEFENYRWHDKDVVRLYFH